MGHGMSTAITFLAASSTYKLAQKVWQVREGSQLQTDQEASPEQNNNVRAMACSFSETKKFITAPFFRKLHVGYITAGPSSSSHARPPHAKNLVNFNTSS